MLLRETFAAEEEQQRHVALKAGMRLYILGIHVRKLYRPKSRSMFGKSGIHQGNTTSGDTSIEVTTLRDISSVLCELLFTMRLLQLQFRRNMNVGHCAL